MDAVANALDRMQASLPADYEERVRREEAETRRVERAKVALEYADACRRLVGTFADGIPRRYQGATLADLPEPRRQALASWREAGAPWCLVVSGPPGTGKTHGAVALGWAAVRAQESALFVSWAAWLDGRKRAMDAGPQAVDIASYGGLLVLDDVGAGRLTDWAVGELCMVIAEREAEVRQTLITTNANIDDFGALDGRLASRLLGGRWLVFSGQDLRPTIQTPRPEDPAPIPRANDKQHAVELVGAEAARQGLHDVDARLFVKVFGPDLYPGGLEDWRTWLPYWHRAMTAPGPVPRPPRGYKVAHFDDPEWPDELDIPR